MYICVCNVFLLHIYVIYFYYIYFFRTLHLARTINKIKFKIYFLY